MRYLLILLVCWAGAVGASTNATWCPDNRLLDAVCQIESSGGRFVWGDGGRSLGYFQIQKAAWTDVSKWRKNRNLPVYDYRENVSNPHLNRIYAADYFTILHASLEVQYRREPTEGELYAAYNMGLTNFKKCNYSLPNVN
ncbi:MAG: transglycosylase SLT domain-containing protein, partial [Verrucomicrobiota bacterium]